MSKEVIIVGAGMAGLTAALRLCERGYDVALYEQEKFVGGKWRATPWEGAGGKVHYHEHSYHMYLNWYHNFWNIAEDIGAFDNFRPMTGIKFLRKHQFPRTTEIHNLGSLADVPQNIFSGVVPIPDMIIYLYSLIDLMATPMSRERFRNLVSVNGFVSSKYYGTDNAAKMYELWLAKAFAVSSFNTSAKTFQQFIEFGTQNPVPMYYMMKGDCYTQFLQKLEEKLRKFDNFKFIPNHRLTKIEFVPEGRVSQLSFQEHGWDYSPSRLAPDTKYIGTFVPNIVNVSGSVILALPHTTLLRVLDADLRAVPQLCDLIKLRSEPMASVHLHLNEKFVNRLRKQGVKSLPNVPVICMDSKFGLSFVDNSQLWEEEETPYLNVVASDFRPLSKLAPGVSSFTADARYLQGGRIPQNLSLDIHDPTWDIEFILKELREYLYFEDDEITLESLQIDANLGRDLFINDVGSWEHRADTVTDVKNLFIAADHCRTPIDVVSLESATFAGLMAAEAIRTRVGVGAPVDIYEPERLPRSLFMAMKAMFAPYAAAAKLWALIDERPN